MRLSALACLLGAASLAVAYDPDEPVEQEGHIFNGQRVPEMLELTAETFEQETHASKFLIVKNYRFVATADQQPSLSWKLTGSQSLVPSLPIVCADI